MIEQKYYTKVKNFFNGDDKKTWLWFHTENPLLGNYSPMQMIKLGREKKLRDFLNTATEENFRKPWE